MAAITITRATSEQLIQEKIPFTVIPNFLIYCAELGLKPRDTAVFNYLYSQNAEKFKKLIPSAIANALGIGESTVRRALTALVKAGLATFKRFSDGETAWKISLPAFNKKPHSQKPHVEKPHVQISEVLERNNLLEKNKETTTAVVLPDYVNQQPVKQALSKLEAKTQALVLQIMIAAMTKGGIKSPVAYMLGLIKKANNGVLEAIAVEKTGVNPVDKERQRSKDLIAFMQKHREKLAIDFQTKDFVRSETFGNITWVVFRDFEAGKL